MVSNNVVSDLNEKDFSLFFFPEIFNLYWHKVAEDVRGLDDESPLWLTGRVKKPIGVGRGRAARSRFVNIPMGDKEQAKVARYIADTLQLDDAEAYTGHSLRRTSASHMSAAGATAETLRRKVNFHNFP